MEKFEKSREEKISAALVMSKVFGSLFFFGLIVSGVMVDLAYRMEPPLPAEILVPTIGSVSISAAVGILTLAYFSEYLYQKHREK